MKEESEKKQKFRCDSCGACFYITIKPSLCPLCGSHSIYRGSKKAKETADKYISEINALIPQLNDVSERFSGLYSRYMIIHETLRCYAARGLIDKESIPNFCKPNLTDAFYASRKRRKDNAEN